MAVPSRAIALRSEKIFTVPSTVFHFFARARGGTNVRDILVRCSYDTGYHHFPGWLPIVPRRGVFATRTEPGLVAGGPRSGVPAALDPGAETCGPLSERSYDRSRSHSEHPLTRKPMTLV